MTAMGPPQPIDVGRPGPSEASVAATATGEQQAAVSAAFLYSPLTDITRSEIRLPAKIGLIKDRRGRRSPFQARGPSSGAALS